LIVWFFFSAFNANLRPGELCELFRVRPARHLSRMIGDSHFPGLLGRVRFLLRHPLIPTCPACHPAAPSPMQKSPEASEAEIRYRAYICREDRRKVPECR
jgi:hypothetical protein